MKILLIDPHPVLLSGLKQEVKRYISGARVLQAFQISEGIEMIKKNIFDLIIIEIGLKGGGLEAIKRIKTVSPSVKILVYSALDEAVYALSAVFSGANGFLSKERAKDELKVAIMTVIDSQTYLDGALRESVVSKAMWKMTGSFAAPFQSPFQVLSRREQIVMRLLIEGYKVGEIAVKLEIKESTVSSFKSNLFKKLQVASVVELAKKIEILN
ncbi:DNA-binding response regulator, NarL/FixJ family, contains REC and HTH domains [Dyadobacter soli]|uniref:DNA-binding response regulator, NarL/FixJ family, contains REC and HTH domains n=1 Tax=Dyadobacter soli TaxID=659014 RepID=A0A1G7EBL2_9BACT|nr:response regulator transcription factor [Dyadobacter soli]SDE61049.1 DNA-binding response regulator, NarL/FixJ family, contains REC and HTH domains [Dyadobacter soli]